jgi:hypothetical protein
MRCPNSCSNRSRGVCVSRGTLKPDVTAVSSAMGPRRRSGTRRELGAPTPADVCVVSSRRTIPPPPTSARSGLTKVDASRPWLESLGIRELLVIEISGSCKSRVWRSRCSVDGGNGMGAADTQRGCQVPVAFPPRSSRVSVRIDNRQGNRAAGRRPSVACQSKRVSARELWYGRRWDVARRIRFTLWKGELRASRTPTGAGTRWWNW